MKGDGLQMETGFQAIKAKTVNLSPDIIAVKSSWKIHEHPPVLKVLAASTAPTKPPAQREENKVLPPVELIINKRVKQNQERRHGLSLQAANQSDRKVIEQLRHHLRTQPHEGTTSVLEAIGDPQIPVDDQFKESQGIVLPFTLSRHQATSTRNAKREIGGSKQTISFLPSVVGNSVGRKSNGENSKLSDYYLSDKRNIIEPSDSIGRTYHEQQFSRKIGWNLPRIKKMEDDTTKTKDRVRKTMENNAGRERHAPATVQLPTRRSETRPIETLNGFPRRAATTANGKAHLIGPMNKMNMIADYSRSMQGGEITYNEYIRRISVLSFHKVALPNSTNRHFQIVRDEEHNMRPHLAHVDVTPMYSSTTSPAKTQRHSEKVARTVRIENEITAAYNKPTKERSCLHRVDIGEGLMFNESAKPTDLNNDLIFTNLTRYSHVHHPKQQRSVRFHWNHESGAQSHQGEWSHREMGEDKFQSQIDVALKQIAQPSTMLSQKHHPNHADQRSMWTTSRGQPGSSLLAIGETKESNIDVPVLMGISPVLEKLPELKDVTEFQSSIGIEADDFIKPITTRIEPSRHLHFHDDAGDESDAESVIQQHIDNVLKSINKAKCRKSSNVPELVGLKPTVVPQYHVNNIRDQTCKSFIDGNKTEKSNKHIALHEAQSCAIKNSPSGCVNNITGKELVHGIRPNTINFSPDFENITGRGSPPKLRIHTADNMQSKQNKINTQSIVTTTPKDHESPSSPPDEVTVVQVSSDSVDLPQDSGVHARLEIVITSNPSANSAFADSSNIITKVAEEHCDMTS